MRRIILIFVAAAILGAIGAASAFAVGGQNGGGHTPVTICHKPGTPAEHTLVVDDDAVPAHLAHGDYLGPCEGTPPPPPPDTTPTDTTPAPAPPKVEAPDAPAAQVCPAPVVQTVYVPVTKTKVVVRWKTKVVYRTKVVTRVVVKQVKVYVPGIHKNGVEGSG